MSYIKCIVFDWGGVLIENPVDDFALECSKKLGVNANLLKTTYANYALSFETGRISETELWKLMGENLNIKIDKQNSIWYQCFSSVYKPRKNMFELVNKLKQNGYTTALLSNTEMPAMEFFLEQNYSMFDYAVFSCKEGTAKPEKYIYLKLLDKTKFEPEETLFIDDKIENVVAAKSLNMFAIQYINFQNLLINFKNYKIKF